MDISFHFQEVLDSQKFQELLITLYGSEQTDLIKQKERYKKLMDSFNQCFSEEKIHLFSAPGRAEISGNHTDHNMGRVLATAINLDTIGAASKTETGEIVIWSEGYSTPFTVDLNESLTPRQEEYGTTTALIRGIAARLKELGFQIGGFHACISSDVGVGSGLSSSASIELLIGHIFCTFYNENRIDPKTLAMVCRYAENTYFNKPCGLMDQLTCAVGGIIAIDFKNIHDPDVKKIDFNLEDYQYHLLVVDTGENHTDLTEDYASIPKEMVLVAKSLGGTTARDITKKQLVSHILKLRPEVGDRAILRTYHYLEENQRVFDQIKSLENGNLENFLQLVIDSGNSSLKWLQNAFSVKEVKMQGISLGLALTEDYLKPYGRGAYRIHGGGFGGTVLIFMPNDLFDEYISLMHCVFGENSVNKLLIRTYGSVHLNILLDQMGDVKTF